MKNILTEQAKHPLSVCLRELRWGRPAEAQKFLTKLADKLERKSRQRQRKKQVMTKRKLDKAEEVAGKLVQRRNGELRIAGVLVWNLSDKEDRSRLVHAITLFLRRVGVK